MIKKTAEIDTTLLNPNKAIDTHYQWLVSMFHNVIVRDTSESEMTNNHSYGLCQFGWWINHPGPLDNDELPYAQLVDSAHQHIYSYGRELMLVVIESCWQDMHFDVFQEGLLSFIAALTDYKIHLLTIQSNMDVLTGLSSRRILDESFDHQLHNVEPLNFYLMLPDIDRSKLVSDTYERLISDVVLHILATYLASWARDYGTVYRCGDGEFIIIVKTTNDEEACRVGVRTYQLVDNHAITYSEGHINITVTAGVNCAFPEEPLDVIIGRVDRAVYEGEQTERNRYIFVNEQNVINRV